VSRGKGRWYWRHTIASEHSDNNECPRTLLRGLKEGQVDRANCMALAGSVVPDLHSDSFHISRVHEVANCQAERNRSRYRLDIDKHASRSMNVIAEKLSGGGAVQGGHVTRDEIANANGIT